MHCASPTTAITVIENILRPDQQVFSTTLVDPTFEQVVQQLNGPVLLLLGIMPRNYELMPESKRRVI
ncbi:MAG: hypothetical protein OXC62_16235 [Aestuariivita sp.]|nr:hypothetical protein [Aestuariivita sp.]